MYVALIVGAQFWTMPGWVFGIILGVAVAYWRWGRAARAYRRGPWGRRP